MPRRPAPAAALSTGLILLLATAAPAAAYIDPGSGSLFLQMLLAGLLAAGMTLKVYWRKLKGLFTRRRDEDEPPARS